MSVCIVFNMFLFLCKFGSIKDLLVVKFIWFLLKLEDSMLMVLLLRFRFLFVLKFFVFLVLLGLIRWCSMGWIINMMSMIMMRLFIISLSIGKNSGCFYSGIFFIMLLFICVNGILIILRELFWVMLKLILFCNKWWIFSNFFCFFGLLVVLLFLLVSCV